MVVLIDTNVIIDFLSGRAGFEDARDVIGRCIDGEFIAYMTAQTVVNTFFILRKAKPQKELRRILCDLIDAIPVADVGNDLVLGALSREDFPDFEDCVQDECASSVGASYIVTRNTKDFATSKVPAILPQVFLSLLG